MLRVRRLEAGKGRFRGVRQRRGRKALCLASHSLVLPLTSVPLLGPLRFELSKEGSIVRGPGTVAAAKRYKSHSAKHHGPSSGLTYITAWMHAHGDTWTFVDSLKARISYLSTHVRSFSENPIWSRWRFRLPACLRPAATGS